ncbi:hypothetical protein B484DRAFT_411326, partial [Ochromonadaceae sp. CCMP2298]
MYDVVSFSASQPISGVSVSDYQAFRALYNLTLSEAIAAAMTGVEAGDVRSLDLAPTSARMLTPTRHLPSRMLDTDAFATYDVRVHSPLSYETLSAQLQASVDSGEFDAALSQYAEANGATGLASATSGPTIAPTPVPTALPIKPTVLPTQKPGEPTTAPTPTPAPSIRPTAVPSTASPTRNPDAPVISATTLTVTRVSITITATFTRGPVYAGTLYCAAFA